MVTIGTAARVCQTTASLYAEQMLLRYFSLLWLAPAALFMLIAAFGASMLVGLAFHEFSHAYVADRLGDGTPRRAGRLTLDPRVHLDPLGSLLILFVGFGWAKPTPVNVRLTRNPRLSMVLVAGAGPLSNLGIAILAGIPIRLELVPFFHPFIPPSLAARAAEVWTASPADLVGLFLGTVVILNVMLAVFNLLPLAPLDGFRVLVGLLPPHLGRELSRLEAWGPGVLMLLFFLPILSGGRINPISEVMAPAIALLLRVVAGEPGRLIFG